MNPEQQDTKPVLTKPERLLGVWEWSTFLVVTLISFVLYVYSMAPSVTLEDSGELATAGDNLGVPHPPGYPLWTILVWLLSKLLWFVEFRGQPNPAWTIALASAVFGALSSGLIAMLICRSGRDMLSEIRKRTGSATAMIDNIICWAGATSASLLFAFSMAMWTQSNIVEVYSLNTLVVAFILLLGYAWMHQPLDKFLFGIALAVGLGMGDWYPSVMLVSIAIVVLVLIKDIKLFRDFSAVGMVIVGMILLNIWLAGLANTPAKDGGQLYPWASKLLWSQGPYSLAFWVYFIINCAAIAIGWTLLPRGRTVAICFILAELGLLIYLYMPLVSDLNNPPMNWAYPRTWEGFIHAITRGQYEKVAPGPVFTPVFVDQMMWYGDCLRVQYTIPLCLLGLLVFAGWSIKVGKSRVSALLPCLMVIPVSTIVLWIAKVQGPGFLTIKGSWDFNDPLVLILVLIAVLGLIGMIIGEIKSLVEQMAGESDTSTIDKVLIGLVLLAGLAVLIFGYARNALLLIVSATSPLSPAGKLQVAVFLIIVPVVLTALVAWLMYGPAELRFDLNETSQKWMIVTAVVYLLMSVFMVVMSNLRGDIQDLFIQKVKFIPSYELFAVWMGYGLILGLAFVHKLLDSFKLPANMIAIAGAAMILLLPVYPVVMNSPLTTCVFNKDMLVDEGGANARGDDYGWQFGNYQLRGVEAILEELRPGEPPPPSTNYPPPMGTNAIFFGGTDPGRFVPTYMIYSAHVREDVYLITQNALADHTYMSVMRDLYGDRIWIPALVDNQQAFALFADDVRSGRRPGNVDVKGGRVVVQGVDQVMAINGILCKMIHDHNKWRHPFYVEESYVIPWMYPYMEPHGLILKVNAEPMPAIPVATVKNDMDFWDWYSKRMLRDENFTNNAVARKTFSKLRSAIAGLYEYRQMWKEAETAYCEAVKLCPVSPEAAFRLANMYMSLGKMDEAKKVMSEFAVLDAHNPRPLDMIREIDRRQQMMKRKADLEKELASGGTTIQSVMELSMLYRAMGNRPGFQQLTRRILEDSNLPVEAQMQVLKWYQEDRLYPDIDRGAKLVLARSVSNVPPQRRIEIHRSISAMYREIAQQNATAGKLPEAVEAMHQYLSLTPIDAMAWHELGVMSAFLNRHDEAVRAFLQAIKIANEKARDEFRKDPRMDQFRNLPPYRQFAIGG